MGEGPARGGRGYDLVHLTGDLVGLLDHLEIERAIFVGHDWGGAVVWRMAQEHPERVAGVVGLNTPHPARAPVNPIDIFRRRFGESFYVVQFQAPGNAPDRLFEQNVEKAFDFFFRGPAPRRGSGPPNFAFPQLVAGYDADRDVRPRLLSPEEMAVYVETFRKTGFTGGINWYRNIERNWRRAAELPEIIAAPSPMIMAEHDVVLPPSAADGMEARVPDLEKRSHTGQRPLDDAGAAGRGECGGAGMGGKAVRLTSESDILRTSGQI